MRKIRGVSPLGALTDGAEEGTPQEPPEKPGRPGQRGRASEGPLPAHAGSKPRPSRPAPLAPPRPPNPISAWHRLSNRLTNAAPPIAGRPGRGLGRQASLRASQWKSLKLLPTPELVPTRGPA